jgi:hypothetical protein
MAPHQRLPRWMISQGGFRRAVIVSAQQGMCQCRALFAADIFIVKRVCWALRVVQIAHGFSIYRTMSGSKVRQHCLHAVPTAKRGLKQQSETRTA